MATVTTPFLGRNRRFNIGETVPDDDPLVAAYPELFGIEQDFSEDDEDDPEGDD